jgi:hypothetical protein
LHGNGIDGALSFQALTGLLLTLPLRHLALPRSPQWIDAVGIPEGLAEPIGGVGPRGECLTHEFPDLAGQAPLIQRVSEILDAAIRRPPLSSRLLALGVRPLAVLGLGVLLPVAAP